jgi:hypothetical protein
MVKQWRWSRNCIGLWLHDGYAACRYKIIRTGYRNRSVCYWTCCDPKIGKTAMSEMTLAAQEWKSAEWAKSRTICSSLWHYRGAGSWGIKFSNTLSSYNPCITEKSTVEGTQHWDTLLLDPCYFGKLVLSEFTKCLAQFKKIELN